MKLKILTLVIFIFCTSKIVVAVNGVIWNKDKQVFVPIFDISTFQSFRSYVLNVSRELETHNFQKQPLKLGVADVRINDNIQEIKL